MFSDYSGIVPNNNSLFGGLALKPWYKFPQFHLNILLVHGEISFIHLEHDEFLTQLLVITPRAPDCLTKLSTESSIPESVITSSISSKFPNTVSALT